MSSEEPVEILKSQSHNLNTNKIFYVGKQQPVYVPCRVPSYTKDVRTLRVKVLLTQQLNLSMLHKLCWCCLQQWDIVVSLWRGTNSFDNSLGCMG